MKFLLFSPIQAGPYTKENGTLAYFEVILSDYLLYKVDILIDL
jgi:hypothetical protein